MAVTSTSKQLVALNINGEAYELAILPTHTLLEVLREDAGGGGVTVYSMVSDIGQGSHNMLATLVAEVLGLRPRDVHRGTASAGSGGDGAAARAASGRGARGRPLTEETIAAAAETAMSATKPMDSLDLPLAYRRRTVMVHVARALRELVPGSGFTT
jgi:Molybdopterin-binding domain of aldehyde dehydrogenase